MILLLLLLRESISGQEMLALGTRLFFLASTSIILCVVGVIKILNEVAYNKYMDKPMFRTVCRYIY